MHATATDEPFELTYEAGLQAVDGDKRIAAFLFVWFLDQNCCLYKPDGSRRLADNTLVALTLLIAESKLEDKDTMVTLVVNLINQEN